MADVPVHLNPGSRIDRWTVEKTLHKGAFGAVYRVTDGQGMYALKTEGINERAQRSAISVGIQCLEALEDLHNMGYLHRDVKPANYTVGRAELNDLRKVYMLDFGTCRKFTDSKGVIRKPRERPGFRGTVRYAPISGHLQRDLCRKDDVEVWIYMCVELTTGNLPWKNIADMNMVGEYKKRCRKEAHVHELFAGCPPEYEECMRYCDSVKYYDTPNYQKMYDLMRKALTTMNVQEFPYDWETPSAPAGGEHV